LGKAHISNTSRKKNFPLGYSAEPPSTNQSIGKTGPRDKEKKKQCGKKKGGPVDRERKNSGQQIESTGKGPAQTPVPGTKTPTYEKGVNIPVKIAASSKKIPWCSTIFSTRTSRGTNGARGRLETILGVSFRVNLQGTTRKY